MHCRRPEVWQVACALSLCPQVAFHRLLTGSSTSGGERLTGHETIASRCNGITYIQKSNKAQPTHPSSDDQQQEQGHPLIPSRQVDRHQVASHWVGEGARGRCRVREQHRMGLRLVESLSCQSRYRSEGGKGRTVQDWGGGDCSFLHSFHD